MQESKLLGKLLPTSPDFLPIVQQLRAKYRLPERAPDDEPIKEIFLEGERVAPADFRQEIKRLVEANTDYLPAEFAKIVSQARGLVQKPAEMVQAEGLAPEYIDAITASYEAARKLAAFVVHVVDPFFTSIADMLFTYLLTGEIEEMPEDWLSKVMTTSSFGETTIIAMASQAANPDVIVEEFRRQYRKAFGAYRPRVTPLAVSTTYYLRLQRAGKPWDFIVEEFIRLNELKLPRDRQSERYRTHWNQISKRLRKRMERVESVLSILLGDKK